MADNKQRLLEEAKKWLGKDASPFDYANDELFEMTNGRRKCFLNRPTISIQTPPQVTNIGIHSLRPVNEKFRFTMKSNRFSVLSVARLFCPVNPFAVFRRISFQTVNALYCDVFLGHILTRFLIRRKHIISEIAEIFFPSRTHFYSESTITRIVFYAFQIASFFNASPSPPKTHMSHTMFHI